jgi:uncharacterized protein (DUF58 family)
MASSRPSRFLSRPRAAVAARMRRWARARQGEDNPPLILHSRRIYILPTNTGIVATALLFVMLIAGMNYSNSLALFLCFMLSGVALVSMHECHRTLSGLKLLRAEVENCFAGQHGELLLHFENADRRARVAIQVRCAPCDSVSFQLQPSATRTIRLPYEAGKRGPQPIDRLELSTQAPIGLFRAWTWLHLPLEALIYPAPGGSRALPPPRGRPRIGQQTLRRQGEEEWAWLRPFQMSDPPRSVAWKAYARGAPLLVAHYDCPAGTQRVLDLESLRALPLEQKLSQLTRWVLDCERRGESYALQLQSLMIDAGHGLAQRRACLEALARYGL